MKFAEFTFFLLIYILPFTSLQAETMRIAVMDLKANNVPNSEAQAVTDLIRADLVDTGMFTVVERGQMNEVLKEQALQQTGCTDNACAVEVGKLLSANKILLGEISKIGSTVILTVRIVDVEKGVAEFSSTEKVKSMDVLDTAVSSLVKRLIDTIGGKRISEFAGVVEVPDRVSATEGVYKNKIVVSWNMVKNADKYYVFRSTSRAGKYELVNTTSGGSFTDKDVTEGEAYYYKVRAGLFSKFGEYSTVVSGMCGKASSDFYIGWILPGWGQYYYGNTTKGLVFGTAYSASTMLLALSILSYYSAKDIYESTPSRSSKKIFDSNYDNYRRSANNLIYFGSAWIVLYAVNWVDLLWFNKPLFKEDSARIDGESYIDINIYPNPLNGKSETVMALSVYLCF